RLDLIAFGRMFGDDLVERIEDTYR
ncbi:hypothetical protein LCGC14_2667280, partial [marine sediment metagenome]